MANYKITDIEGIGPTFGEKLTAAGINDTDTLLKECASASGRKGVAEKTGITESMLLKWANMADLYRITGVGSEYSELLHEAGVDTVPELAQRNAANLTASMLEVNEKRNLTRKPPTETSVQKWIDEAKTLAKVITH
ncbi:MAG: DUF4332 domain-containing protein [Phycisphaeraceae bacterium]|nr:DUF4332 domain-containing protein [Phycisphaerales bacterium]MCB9860619.1 DUF4332 domain-containing protein [Phycisphaeraceae bacterium]